MKKNKAIIGIIGAGKLGTTLAKQLLKANYQVKITNSRDPKTLTLILKVLAPQAQATTIKEVVKGSDIIILAIPLNQYKKLDPSLFINKIVIDAMNYWPTTEGHIEEFEDKKSTSSEHMQKHLSKAKIVKSLNHIAYNELEEHSLHIKQSNRRAILLVGNFKEANLIVSKLIKDLGFDPVDLGSLKNGKKFQPDTKLFNTRYTAIEVE